jgi:hypothetical protein
MSASDERNVDPLQEMHRLAQNHLDLVKWGFKESYSSSRSGNLIYDSELCRVNLVWGGWDYIGGNSISMYYGRLHAPNEKATFRWNGEECYCWHRFEHALHFLDGHTPVYHSKMLYTHSLIEEYENSQVAQKLKGKNSQPEWLVRMHAMVWEHYAPRLFELFDLRRPDLWEQYRQFLKQVYDIKGRSPNIKPSLDQVC